MPGGHRRARRLVVVSTLPAPTTTTQLSWLHQSDHGDRTDGQTGSGTNRFVVHPAAIRSRQSIIKAVAQTATPPAPYPTILARQPRGNCRFSFPVSSCDSLTSCDPSRLTKCHLGLFSNSCHFSRSAFTGIRPALPTGHPCEHRFRHCDIAAPNHRACHHQRGCGGLGAR
jgi:hypothetical protein